MAWSIAVCAAAVVLRAAADQPQTSLVSIAQLQSAVSTNSQAIESFRVEGVVCASLPQPNMFVLQDDSATALLQLPAGEKLPSPGDSITLAGENCLIARKQFGIRIGPDPVVDNDGIHPAMLASGKAFLKAGLQPIRLSWFSFAGHPICGWRTMGRGCAAR